MFSETTDKVLVFVALVIIGYFLYRIIINYNTNKNKNIIEGLVFGNEEDEDDEDDELKKDTMSDKNFNALKLQVNKLKKLALKEKSKLKLNKPGVREQYEDMLNHIDSYLGGKIFQYIGVYAFIAANEENRAGNFTNKDIVQLVKTINMMSEFQESINKNLTQWLDNQGDNITSSDSGNMSW